ncbi:unnamed protein product, partial [Meganyctiphanes norvegica]
MGAFFMMARTSTIKMIFLSYYLYYLYYLSLWENGPVEVLFNASTSSGERLFHFSNTRLWTESGSPLTCASWKKIFGFTSSLPGCKAYLDHPEHSDTQIFFFSCLTTQKFFPFGLEAVGSKTPVILASCKLSIVFAYLVSNSLLAARNYLVVTMMETQITKIKPKSGHVCEIRTKRIWISEVRRTSTYAAEGWQLNKDKVKLHTSATRSEKFGRNVHDFSSIFKDVYITSLNPNTLNKDALAAMDNLADLVEYTMHTQPLLNNLKPTHKLWSVKMFEGSWVKGSSAGGSFNNRKKFSCNPQYILTLTETDDDSDKCSVLISLMQKNKRNFGLKMHGIAVYIFKIDDTGRNSILPENWFCLHRPTYSTSPFRPARSVSQRFELPLGCYCIIPTTFKEDQEAEFLLRVFCEKKAAMEENDEELMALDEPDEIDGIKFWKGTLSTERTEEVSEIFYSITNVSQFQSIEADQLAKVLSQLHPGVDFNGDLCYSLLGLIDENFSGDIDIYELMALEEYLSVWIDTYDSKKDPETGLLSGHSWGLGEALKSLGIQLPRRLQALLVVRYRNEDGHFNITNFIWATARITLMINRFMRNANPDGRNATMDIEMWLQNSIYCA